MKDLKEFAEYTAPVFSREDMAAVEQNCAELGISQTQLMENAGNAVARIVSAKFPKAKDVLVVCGLGNNGGDGFVAARRLLPKYAITVALTGKARDIKRGPALENFNMLKQLSANIKEDCKSDMPRLLKNKDLIIDAIFGTGFHGKMPKEEDTIIKTMNRSGVPVVAVDLPSGLDANTGKAESVVKADYIITFHKNKLGLTKLSTRAKLEIADIGIPIDAEIYAGIGDVNRATQPRKLLGSKKDNGSVAIIGGSKGYHGAPTLSSNAAYATLAALRVGIGYAMLYVPGSIANVVRTVSPNLVVREVDKDIITESAVPRLKDAIDRADAAVMGIGMGRERTTEEAVRKVADYAIKKEKKIVIDADALYALRKARLAKTAVLTPEDKQFAHLAGVRLSTDDLRERVRAAVELAKKMNAVILLKGHYTVITDGTRVKINRSYTSGLATMGTGDVLAGIIGGYAASGADAFEAGVAGAYVHSRIGDALTIEKGHHLLASDVVDYIPKILKAHDKNTT